MKSVLKGLVSKGFLDVYPRLANEPKQAKASRRCHILTITRARNGSSGSHEALRAGGIFLLLIVPLGMDVILHRIVCRSTIPASRFALRSGKAKLLILFCRLLLECPENEPGSTVSHNSVVLIMDWGIPDKSCVKIAVGYESRSVRSFCVELSYNLEPSQRGPAHAHGLMM